MLRKINNKNYDCNYNYNNNNCNYYYDSNYDYDINCKNSKIVLERFYQDEIIKLQNEVKNGEHSCQFGRRKAEGHVC